MRERKGQREAWTKYFEGNTAPAKTNKYGVAPKEERGKYASVHEMRVAASLSALASRGMIQELREQVSFTLVEGDGKIRPIRYVSDFTWKENGVLVIADAKGAKTPMYRLKKKMMWLLLGLEIREL
jgi:hypothetical protein